MNKIRFNCIFLLFSLSTYTSAQYFAAPVPAWEEVIRSAQRVADYTLKNTTYLYFDRSKGTMTDNIEAYGYNQNIIPQSIYNRWAYANGVLHIAFNSLGTEIKEDRYINYTKKNFEFFYKDYNYLKSVYNGQSKWNFPLGQAFVMEELDDCGAIGASLIELYLISKKAPYKEFIDRTANHIMNVQMRMEDGTLSRPKPEKNTVWADDLYMSVPFLARMGKLSGDKRYYDEAARQVILFNHHLYDENSGLFWHCYYGEQKKTGATFWGRCNGWVIMATADLLQFLPENHSKRDSIISLLNRQIIGLAQYQSQSGLWHQILHKTDSYLETSASAMFTYSIALAINKGWVDRKYQSIAIAGWRGVNTQITLEGGVKNICIGTGIGNDITFYYDRPVSYSDSHGVGAVIMAGIEVSKLIQTMQ